MVELRDGVRLATDVYLPEGRGAVPDAPDRVRGSRSAGFIVGVLIVNPLESVRRGYAVVVQEVRGRSGSEARVASLRARGRPTARTASTGCCAQPWCDGRIGVYGTAYSAVTALYDDGARPAGDRRRAPCSAPAPTIHDGWVYTSGAFELGWNVYWAYMTLSESITRLDVDEETRAALQSRVRRRRSARRPTSRRACRSPTIRCSSACGERPVPRVAGAPRLRRLLGVVRRARRAAAAACARCCRSSGWHDNFLKSHFDLYPGARAAGRRPPAACAARGST